MEWIQLTSIEDLILWDEKSKEKPLLIFKHSIRCMTSRMVLGRLERNWSETLAHTYTPLYLDLIQYRKISQTIVDRYGVAHESPQLLIIKSGKCVFHASHTEISVDQLLEPFTT